MSLLCYSARLLRRAIELPYSNTDLRPVFGSIQELLNPPKFASTLGMSGKVFRQQQVLKIHTGERASAVNRRHGPLHEPLNKSFITLCSQMWHNPIAKWGLWGTNWSVCVSSTARSAVSKLEQKGIGSQRGVRLSASITLAPPVRPPPAKAPSQPLSRSSSRAASLQAISHVFERSPGNLHVPPQPPGPSNRSPGASAESSTTARRHAHSELQPSIMHVPTRAVVEGTVKTITLENRTTGYVVAKIKVADGAVPSEKLHKKGIVTAVATHKQMLLGQKVRLEGTWGKHKKYGHQLQVENLVAFEVSEKEGVIAMLQGAALPGVGPVTAARLADKFGASLAEVMDAPDAASQLCTASGIGPKSAHRIKNAWDSTRGRREAATFLQELGLSGKVVQRIVARHGNETRAVVTRDPYYAMRNIKGVNLRLAESVAQRLEAEDQLASRASMAMTDVLLEAARQRGHTYLPWEQLQQQALQHLNASGKPWQGSNLEGIARKAAEWGDIVVEHGDIATPEASSPGVAEKESVEQVEAALKAYLSSRIPGVGPKRAQCLVDHFGDKIVRVLEKFDAAKELGSVPGIPHFVAKDIKTKWDQNPRRKTAWVPPILGVEVPPASARLPVEQVAVPDMGVAWTGTVRCYHPEMHTAETTVARELSRLAARRPLSIKAGGKDPQAKVAAWIDKNEKATGVKLSEGQKAAVRAASTSPILILTGGPGCGKTYTTATIVKLWCAMKREVRLAAPTGRASQRLQEMASLPSSTIHRLLQYKAAGSRSRGDVEDEEELEGSYTFCRSNPLPAEAVLVDEAAMLDVNLAAALLEALPPHCQLVLVGDVDQLPPVGPGTVLSAAIQSGVIPVIDLREIFRQAQQSDIVTAAHSVQQGKFPDLKLLPPLALEEKFPGPSLSEALWVKPEGASDGKSLQDLVVKVLRNYIHPLGFNPATDVQVLVPMRRGVAGVEPMNQQLQSLLNPAREEVPELHRYSSRPGGPVFRFRDRVIQTINNYEREVFNGDPGFIVDVNVGDKSLTVEYPESDYTKIMQGHSKKQVEYKASSLWELDMAWATTVHKAQGGESPVVVLMLSNSHRPLLTCRLLYTALTRAKRLVVVVSPEKALQTAVAEVRGDMRLSSLQPRLQAQAQCLGVAFKSIEQYGYERTPTTVEVAASSEIPKEVVEELASRKADLSDQFQPPQDPSTRFAAATAGTAGPVRKAAAASRSRTVPRAKATQKPFTVENVFLRLNSNKAGRMTSQPKGRPSKSHAATSRTPTLKNNKDQSSFSGQQNSQLGFQELEADLTAQSDQRKLAGQGDSADSSHLWTMETWEAEEVKAVRGASVLWEPSPLSTTLRPQSIPVEASAEAASFKTLPSGEAQKPVPVEHVKSNLPGTGTKTKGVQQPEIAKSLLEAMSRQQQQQQQQQYPLQTGLRAQA